MNKTVSLGEALKAHYKETVAAPPPLIAATVEPPWLARMGARALAHFEASPTSDDAIADVEEYWRLRHEGGYYYPAGAVDWIDNRSPDGDGA